MRARVRTCAASRATSHNIDAIDAASLRPRRALHHAQALHASLRALALTRIRCAWRSCGAARDAGTAAARRSAGAPCYAAGPLRAPRCPPAPRTPWLPARPGPRGGDTCLRRAHSCCTRAAAMSAADAPPAAASAPPAPLLSAQLYREMAASGLGGMVADGITYPACTVKNRMQAQGAARAGGYAYRGPFDAVATIVRKEGWRTLFKGFSTVLPVAPAQALYMGGYQGFRRLQPGDPDSPAVQFVGGVVATLTQSIAMVPLEVVRQRQQVQTAADRAAGAGYRGSLHAAAAIARVEGPFALYRGFGVTQAVWAPFNAVYLPLWEGGKRLGVALSGAASPAELPLRYELAAAFVSSAFAAAISNPMDVVKTRLQVAGASNVAAAVPFRGAAHAARSIYAAEGLRGFARGAAGRVLWVAPSTAIMFTAYDNLERLFARIG